MHASYLGKSGSTAFMVGHEVDQVSLLSKNHF